MVAVSFIVAVFVAAVVGDVCTDESPLCSNKNSLLELWLLI